MSGADRNSPRALACTIAGLSVILLNGCTVIGGTIGMAMDDASTNRAQGLAGARMIDGVSVGDSIVLFMRDKEAIRGRVHSLSGASVGIRSPDGHVFWVRSNDVDRFRSDGTKYARARTSNSRGLIIGAGVGLVLDFWLGPTVSDWFDFDIWSD